MAAKITPRLIELTYEAALKAYWRKNALRKFLRASHVAESFLSSWDSDESKRELLDRLFQKLQATDKGKGRNRVEEIGSGLAAPHFIG